MILDFNFDLKVYCYLVLFFRLLAVIFNLIGSKGQVAVGAANLFNNLALEKK